MMRFNMHILRHFGANCRRWGPIFALSAYAFEAGIQKLKKLIHSTSYIPNQICRRLSENNASVLLKNNCSSVTTQLFEEDIDASFRTSVVEIPGKIRLLQKSKPFHPTQKEQWFLDQLGMEHSGISVFPELLKEGCRYGSQVNARKRKTDNSFARLHANTFIRISKILYHAASQKVFIAASKIRCEPSRFCPPSIVRHDSDMCFQYAVSSIDEDIDFFDVHHLKQICVSAKFDHGHYLHPMPNIFNMF
ncbi:hypothetical protein ONE63_008207 [Megalurothrips usitatus]|uniref:Uncharacterized protein n=1 Tax=Megalurothrips usitatus TaxID=439358 RepID=A0AAV7XSZ5_9NEOP|nr:hypothetical protein ONE63_008207 [Megalurothrips usitatus]